VGWVGNNSWNFDTNRILGIILGFLTPFWHPYHKPGQLEALAYGGKEALALVAGTLSSSKEAEFFKGGTCWRRWPHGGQKKGPKERGPKEGDHIH